MGWWSSGEKRTLGSGPEASESTSSSWRKGVGCCESASSSGLWCMIQIIPVTSMSARERIIKGEKIELTTHLARSWALFSEALPSISAVQLGVSIASVLSFCLEAAAVGVLLAQTAHILAGEKRYINLRHLLIKWISLLLALLAGERVQHYTAHPAAFGAIWHCLALLLVLPSKFLRDLHLKYFSFGEKRRYDQAGEDPTSYEMSLTSRTLVSLTLFCLNASRFMITFVPPAHRRKIEEAMRGVNMVIVEEKYFWKMYEPNSKQQPQDPMPTLNLKTSTSQQPQPPKTQAQTNLRESVVRAKAGEYIAISMGGLGTNGSNRKFSFYRQVSVTYNTESSVLTLIGEADGKATEHVLAEVEVLEENMVQLECEDQEDPIFLRFKAKKDMDVFVGSIFSEEDP